jgi:hypothetical protein
MQIAINVKINQLLAYLATWLPGATMISPYELEFHRTLMSLIRMVRNLRAIDCDHCADLLTDVYKCLDKETDAIRNRSNDG